MKSMRYIVTRPCLQEGSLSILKYLQPTFNQSGPAVFVDDKGDEHNVQVDTERARIWGLGGLYHAQHLGVNDVLTITNLAPARYQVEAIVKPYAPPVSPRREPNKAPETRRVVVSSTPHVREVRMQEVPQAQSAQIQSAQAQPAETRSAGLAEASETGVGDVRVTEVRASAAEAAAQTQVGRVQADRVQGRPPAERTQAEWGGVPVPSQLTSSQPVPSVSTSSASAPAGSAATAQAVAAGPSAPTPRAAPEIRQGEDARQPAAHLAELAHLTGYRLDDLGGGVLRLKAELGAHGYAVLVALDEQARTSPAWNEEPGYRVMLCNEGEDPQGVSRLTHEALAALIEHARLSPLSPVDLRGYWKAGHVDMESAASVAELVSAYLAQRGVFSFVLLTLAQQPAHSVISVPRLAEKLGSGVNYAELGSILETLTRAPFLALTPLPGGQFLLRVGVADLLTDLAEYADGVRRRVRTPAGSRPEAAQREGLGLRA
ncbi:hypothetical protein [Deinococcus marmoris]|uniref:hypothetical protein n=1 Tax=Deinococcus marmoris TaxID=249408 RepID=UPI000552F269|nr:hypothetical protein [Deinococcus marmoris]